MVKGAIGGGNTLTGIHFEGKVDLVTYLNDSVKGYKCIQKPFIKRKSMGFNIYYNDNLVANSFKKYELYRYLKTQNIDWSKILLRKLLPDNVIFVPNKNTVFIIEVKYQEKSGLVDEKLQTCDFKLKQYKKLFKPLKYEVEYLPLHKIDLPAPITDDLN